MSRKYKFYYNDSLYFIFVAGAKAFAWTRGLRPGLGIWLGEAARRAMNHQGWSVNLK